METGTAREDRRFLQCCVEQQLLQVGREDLGLPREVEMCWANGSGIGGRRNSRKGAIENTRFK